MSRTVLKGSTNRAHCLGDVSESRWKADGGICANAHQRMVTTKNNWKLSSFDMVGNNTCDSLADPGYKSRILHLADRRVVLFRDLFKLVMSVKLNLPS